MLNGEDNARINQAVIELKKRFKVEDDKEIYQLEIFITGFYAIASDNGEKKANEKMRQFLEGK